MKNIQIIDNAINCTYDIFEIDDASFNQMFPNNQDIEFEDDLFARCGHPKAKELLSTLWIKRVDKKSINGIHGTLFFGEPFEDKKPFYPTKKEKEMIANP